MQTNFLDRAIAAVAPLHAAKRLHARAFMDAFGQTNGAATAMAGGEGPPPATSGGRRSSAPARDAKSDSLPMLRSQRGDSRELARTSPIACGAINTNVDRVVGTGVALSANPNLYVLGWTIEQAMAWKRKTQVEFSLWADSAESDQCNTLNFYEQEALVLRSTLESGDSFTLLPKGDPTPTQPYSLRLQVLEADRIGNPLGAIDSALVSGGVRMAATGAPEAYHVYDRHPGSLLQLGMPGGRGGMYSGEWIPCKGPSGRRRILHHYRKLRPEMPRGVPYLAPIIDCIKQITQYTEAEISAAVISAYFTVFVKTPTGNSAPIFDGDKPKASSPEINLGKGRVVDLAPGEEVEFANPLRPNPNFDPFIQAVIRQMGMALSIPYELLIKKFDASYSASKAALLDAGIYFRSVRTWLARSFCQPVYETWLGEAVAIGRIEAPGFFTDPLLRWAYCQAAWHGDSMGSINPKDEVRAYLDAVDGRLMTRERAEWELFGTDFNDTLDAKAAEQARLKAADLLPVPKAGAAAPTTKPTTEPTP